MGRPTKIDTFLDVAYTLAKRSTCSRRQVGCVLTDRHDHILSTGYNGVGRSLTHCTDSPCLGSLLGSGTGLEVCEAIHAEQNALLQCPDVNKLVTAYVTSSPCMHCAKLFLNTSVSKIFYVEDYDPKALELLRTAGIVCFKVGREND